MTIITLPPELEATLAEAAKRQGTSPELLAIESLRRQFAPLSAAPSDGNGVENETMFDLLKEFIGTINGSTEPLSEHSGQKFREMIEKRDQEQQ
jgi:hypothetical protein